MKNLNKQLWPALSWEEGRETYQTIHLWTQILGKIKLAKMPWINHSWHVTLIVTPFGLTTGPLSSNGKHFQINIDFLKHQLQITTDNIEERYFDLMQLSVADCYWNILTTLRDLGIEIEINPIPNEIENPTPLNNDYFNKTYQPPVAVAFHKALLKAHEVLTEFRSEFIGKCSPVHFFWGGFDMAVTRFSGRTAPQHPGGVPNLPDWVAREAYSHEVSSCGFWTGNDTLPYAAFYSYTYPEPLDYKFASVEPESAYYNHNLREFILPYSVVQQSDNPHESLLKFLRTTYNAAADLANWDRENLEKHEVLSKKM